MRARPTSEKVEPKRAMLLSETEDPTIPKLTIARDNPRYEGVLTDSEVLTCVMSTTDREERSPNHARLSIATRMLI
jgi:hypothetical protein